MSRWQDLYDRGRELEAQHQRLDGEWRARQAARQEVDDWATEALSKVWVGLEAVLTRRVADFARATKTTVSVAEGHHTRWAGPNKTRMLVIETALVTVYLYSHQVSGSEPTFHLVEWPTSDQGRRQRHRMVTLPVARIARVDREGFRVTKPDSSEEPLEYDDMVYRALELLVAGMRRAVPRQPPEEIVASAFGP